LFVIEDTAQAIGAVYRGKSEEVRIKSEELGVKSEEVRIKSTLNSSLLPLHSEIALNSSLLPLNSSAGTIGDIGTTSFFPSKNLGCYGDGGALMTNNDELAAKIRMICNHGQSVQYVHDVIGVNSRLDSIQAAVLSAKLPHLKSYAAARNEAAGWYDELLGGIEGIQIPVRSASSTHVFHQYTIRVKSEETLHSSLLPLHSKRDQLRKSLAEKGIPTMVYYPIELHRQKAFAKYWDGVERFPVSEELVQTVLSLPMHTEMTREMVAYVCKAVVESIDHRFDG
jgi:dTDP-4-amino-4,6-dideoxygalactose transaminase